MILNLVFYILILTEFYFIKVQNDFLDCFGEPGVLKKPGTDIQDGKCTWPAILAIQLASEQQKSILEKCYGQNGKNCQWILNEFISIEIPGKRCIHHLQNHVFRRVNGYFEFDFYWISELERNYIESIGIKK